MQVREGEATERQVETLKQIAAGNVRRCRIDGGTRRIVGANPYVVGRVISFGWAKWLPRTTLGEEALELTTTGRAEIGDYGPEWETKIAIARAKRLEKVEELREARNAIIRKYSVWSSRRKTTK